MPRSVHENPVADLACSADDGLGQSPEAFQRCEDAEIGCSYGARVKWGRMLLDAREARKCYKMLDKFLEI